MFVTELGRVYACGWGADGQTGLGIFDNTGIPSPIKGDITTENIVKIACTADCVLALNGKYYTLKIKKIPYIITELPNVVFL